MDYQGNPIPKNKEEKPDKQIEKVVTGEVISKPKSIGHKFKTVFFGGDLKHSMKFVAADVVLPAFRDLLVDAITNGARRMVYGDSMYRSRRPEYRPRGQYSYNNPVSRPMRDPRERGVTGGPFIPDQRPREYRQERAERDDIILARKEDAETVVERLLDVLAQYEVATLADLYDLLGMRSSHIDQKWGWTYLGNIAVRQVREGYLIELPPLEAV